MADQPFLMTGGEHRQLFGVTGDRGFQPFIGANASGGQGGPPTVTLVSPAEGEIIPSSVVVIDITSPSGLELVMLSLGFPDDGSGPPRAAEVIYSSSRGVGAMYQGTFVAPVASGVRVTMQRLGGWPGRSIRFDPDVVTKTGAINA